MADAQYGRIANMVQGQLRAWPEFLGRCNTFPEITQAPQGGKVEVPVFSSATVVTPTDGTNYTNQVATTSATLTYVDQSVPYKWTHSKHRSISKDPAMLATAVVSMRDALHYNLQKLVTAAIVAATPGLAITITTGNALFVTDGSLAQINVEIGQIMKGIAYLQATNTAAALDVNQITAICDYVTYGNILTLGMSHSMVDISNPTRPLIAGVRIFPVQGDTTIDAVSEPTLLMFTKESVGCAFGMGDITSDPEVTGGDGLHLLDLQVPAGYGVLRANGIVKWTSGSS